MTGRGPGRTGNTAGIRGTSRVVRTWRGRRGWLRPALLVLLLLVVFVAGEARGWPEIDLLRDRVDGAGAAGAALFVGGYALLCLLPAPKALLTTLGGLLYGLWWGALLSWAAAMVGAVAAFALARGWGRGAVVELMGPRLRRVDAQLAAHGTGAVVAARLVPVIPFTAINYAAGATGVRARHFVAGSALGMVPGSLAYAALGAWGTSPWGIFAGLAALVALVAVGSLLGRRLRSRALAAPPVGDGRR